MGLSIKSSKTIMAQVTPEYMSRNGYKIKNNFIFFPFGWSKKKKKNASFDCKSHIYIYVCVLGKST